MHLAIVYHASTKGGSAQRRMECIVNGRVDASVVAPNSLRRLTDTDRSILVLGGSAQFHPAAPGIVAKVVMHHRQALDIYSLQKMMRDWSHDQRPSPRLSHVLQAANAVAVVAGAGADARTATGAGGTAAAQGAGETIADASGSSLMDPNAQDGAPGADDKARSDPGAAEAVASSAEVRAKMIVISPAGSPGNAGHGVLWVQLDEVLAGREHAMMILGNKHLHGIDGVSKSCPLAAAYYKGAAGEKYSENDCENLSERVLTFTQLPCRQRHQGHGGE